MNSALGHAWIPLARIEELVQLEPALVIFGMAAGCWLAYRLLLRKVSASRHGIFRASFRNLLGHLLLFAAFFGAYLALHHAAQENDSLERVAGYAGLLAMITGSAVFVKVARIVVFEYLFFSHMREGVPMLLNNLFTLLLSLVVGGWLVTEIFSVRLAPLLATSAIFSIVLGLALQDTLGNLFAGVALQFDKPYELEDWIEVHGTGGMKWVGQVHEISWRATVLTGLSDESITIPNRVIAQAQISNFATRARPIVRSQTFRLAYDSSREQARKALLRAAARIPGIKAAPEPFVLITEPGESWLLFKLIYFLDDYGKQWVVADHVIDACLEELSREGIQCTPPRLHLQRPRSLSA